MMNEDVIQKVGGGEGPSADFTLDSMDIEIMVGGGEAVFAPIEAGGTEKIADSQAKDDFGPQFMPIPAEDVLKWDDTQETILNAYIADMQEWGGAEMKALAKRLKLTIQDFEEIIIYSTEAVWNRRRMKRLLEIEATKMRGYKWDNVEHATLAKLEALVDAGKITKASELLMIAATANRAQRRGSGVQEAPVGNQNGNNNGVQVNIFGQPAANQPTDLPGAGHVGTVKLSLSKRTLNQLSQERTIDGVEYKRLHERAEMLEPKDISEISKMADESNE